MVSYDVTELITSEYIRSIKRSLSVVIICTNEYMSTSDKTRRTLKLSNNLLLINEKMAAIKSKATRRNGNFQDCSVKEFLVFGLVMREEVVKSMLCGPN